MCSPQDGLTQLQRLYGCSDVIYISIMLYTFHIQTCAEHWQNFTCIHCWGPYVSPHFAPLPHLLAVKKKVFCGGLAAVCFHLEYPCVLGMICMWVRLLYTHASYSMWMRERCPLRHGLACVWMFCVCVCMWACVFITVCVPHNKRSKLTQWQLLAEPQRGPAIQQHRLCRSASLGLSWTSFSLSLSVAFTPFFSEPIFLSEVLIWGAGQWGEGREARGPREGRTGGREERRCGVVMAADGRPFVPPFPGSSLEPPRLQLRWSLPEREQEREREDGRKKKRGHNDLSNWNLSIQQNKCAQTCKRCSDEKRTSMWLKA